MTPTALRRQLRARPDTRSLATVTDPDSLHRSLELLAERNPLDRELAELVAFAHEWATVRHGLLPVTAGLRLGPVLRWGRSTVTVEATEVDTGATVVARLLRATHRDPAWGRALARDAAALAAVPGLGATLRDQEHLAIVAPVDGGPLLDVGERAPSDAVRAAVRIVADLAAREAAGLQAPDPDDDELRLSNDGAQLLCLDPNGDPDVRMGDLAERLLQLLDGAPGVPEGLRTALAGAARFAPASAAELAELVTAALGDELAAHRHALSAKWHDRRHRLSAARLRAMVERLAAYGPPSGVGAVGVDLDGKPTLVRGDGTTLTWGPAEGPQLAILSAQGLHPRTARRMLRARAAAPHNDRLDALVSGEPGFSEAACRWVAAALQLRTLVKLLEVPQ